MSTQTRASLETMRRIAGATILQLAPALDNSAQARAAIDIALALRQAGARAIVAGPGGPRVGELRSLGGEWVRLHHDSVNPVRLHTNVRRLAGLITAERVDVVHAYNAGAAWSAMAATEKLAVWLVTSLPDVVPPKYGPRMLFQTSLARGDHMLSHSSFTAAPMINRFDIPRDRVTVIPHSVDSNLFDPATIRPERAIALRENWKIPQGDRVVLVPGPMTPSAGQTVLVDAVSLLSAPMLQGITFVLMSEARSNDRYSGRVMNLARKRNVADRFRLAGPCTDWPAALAAADIVVMPATEPQIFGRPIPESQAMARPVIASAIGILPENVLAPPRMPADLRTGWLVKPGDPAALAQAMREAFALDLASYRALAARARQFAEFMFSPQSVSASVLNI